MDERDDLDLVTIRQALLSERDEVVAMRDAHAAEAKPVTLDQQSVGRLSRMDAIQVQAMAKVVAARRAVRLQRIDEALARIEEGEFGYCDGCGEDIPAKRLAIDFAITHCIKCVG